MDADQLVAQFRIFSGDTVVPYLWTDAMVVSWLNEAERESCVRAKLILDATTADYCEIDVTAGTTRYELEPKVVDIFRVFIEEADGTLARLDPYDREELDRLDSSWRTKEERPTGYIYDEGAGYIDLNRVPDTTYSLRLEVYRLPVSDIAMTIDGGSGDDTPATSPEIAAKHHLELVSWPLHRAFSIPDADGKNEQLSAVYLRRFEQYFGRKPDATRNRRQRENTPHVNKCHW